MAKTGKSLEDYGLTVFRRDNWTCRYCGFQGHDEITFRLLSVDHVIRQVDGGTDDESNPLTAFGPSLRQRTCASETQSVQGDYEFEWVSGLPPRRG